MLKQKKIILGIGVLGLLSLYFLFDPSVYTSFFPDCLFHKYTGYHCPGCGSQRAIHDLLQGHLLNALSHNVLMVIFILGGTLFYLISKERFLKLAYHPKTPWVVFGFVLIYWVLRNIPYSPFTWLAP